MPPLTTSLPFLALALALFCCAPSVAQECFTGFPCDDNDPTTRDDFCRDGLCRGLPITPEIQIVDGGKMKLLVAPGQDVVFDLGSSLETVKGLRATLEELSTRINTVEANLTDTITTTAAQAATAASLDSSQKSATAKSDAIAEANRLVNSVYSTLSTSQAALSLDLGDKVSAINHALGNTTLPAAFASHSDGIVSLNAMVSSLTTSVAQLSSSMSTRVSSLESTTQRMMQCARAGTAFNGTACVPAASVIVPTTATCSAANLGSVRFDTAKSVLLVCDGNKFVPVFRPPLGSTDDTAAESCEVMANSTDWAGDGYYFIGPQSSSNMQWCQGKINYGNDGSSTKKVSLSCAVLKSTFQKTTGVFYIDLVGPPNPAEATQRYCQDGADMGGDGSTAELNAASCDVITKGFGKPYGKYWVKDAQVYCNPTAAATCQDHRNSAGAAAQSGVHEIINAGSKVYVWCEMEGANGWTLVIKANGNTATWHYDSAIWTAADELNPSSVFAGLDFSDYKSSMFFRMPFRYLRLGFRTVGQADTRWGVLDLGSTNLLIDVFKGSYRSYDIGRDAWMALIPGDGSLQPYCNMQGFNVYHAYSRARIGIIANQENECQSPDSRLGLGTGGAACGMDDTNTVGNECRCTCNRGERSQKLEGYLLMKP